MMVKGKYTCPLCGNKDFEPIELLSEMFVSWKPVEESVISSRFKERPVNGLACTECRHVLIFADNDKHRRRS
jgi:hypothetical protein